MVGWTKSLDDLKESFVSPFASQIWWWSPEGLARQINRLREIKSDVIKLIGVWVTSDAHAPKINNSPVGNTLRNLLIDRLVYRTMGTFGQPLYPLIITLVNSRTLREAVGYEVSEERAIQSVAEKAKARYVVLQKKKNQTA